MLNDPIGFAASTLISSAALALVLEWLYAIPGTLLEVPVQAVLGLAVVWLVAMATQRYTLAAPLGHALVQVRAAAVVGVIVLLALQL